MDSSRNAHLRISRRFESDTMGNRFAATMTRCRLRLTFLIQWVVSKEFDSIKDQIEEMKDEIQDQKSRK